MSSDTQLFQRVIGFAGCAGIGWLFSLIGTLTLVTGPTAQNINTFIVLYVLGNVRLNHITLYSHLFFVKLCKFLMVYAA